MQDNIRGLFIVLLAAGLVLLVTLGGPRDEPPPEQPPLAKIQSGRQSIAATPAAEEQPLVEKPEQSREILDTGKRSSDDLGGMRKRKQIRALVTYSRTDFFFYKGRARGAQVEFLLAYEKFLNRNIKRPENRVHIAFLPVPFDQLIPALNEGRGDIAAAFLTITPQRQEHVDFATGSLFKVSEVVVSNKNSIKLERIEDLSGKRVYVLSNSSYVQHLQQLNRRFSAQGLAAVEIVQADSELLSEDILELVDSGVVDITVIDDYKARLWLQLLPNLQIHDDLKLSRDNPVGWAIRKGNPELGKSLQAYSVKARKGSLLGNMLFRRYYSDTQWIRNPTTGKELKKLTHSIDLFKKYGKQYGFDYLALLAQAYQESALDHSKRSHRGATGIMQIMPATARDPHVSISNIHRLENNIHAGTKYMAFLRDHYFSDPALTPENRQAFSWAAYNAGPANVIKMRNKAKAMGLNPDIWFANVEIAASKLTGRETVQYVAHIHKYYIAYKLASSLQKGDPLFISNTGSGSISGNLEATEAGVLQAGRALHITDLRL